MRAAHLFVTALTLAISLAVGAGSAQPAGNVIPGSRATRLVTATTANTLKPVTCAALTLTAVVGITGTGANELLLGTAAANTMSAAGGNDCVLGGGGNDTINGGAGTDVCIGGPGTDTFTNCETQIQ